MTMVLDERLAQQHEALRKANDVRLYRAETKRQLARAEVSLADLLERPDERLLSARVYDLLMAVPAIGKHKAVAWLYHPTLRLRLNTTVGGLTDRQRMILAAAVLSHQGCDMWRRRRAAFLRSVS